NDQDATIRALSLHTEYSCGEQLPGIGHRRLEASRPGRSTCSRSPEGTTGEEVRTEREKREREKRERERERESRPHPSSTRRRVRVARVRCVLVPALARPGQRSSENQ